MSDTDEKRTTSISGARTAEQIGELWDRHSLADFASQTHEVEIEVTAERRRRVTVAPDLYEEMENRARRLGLGPETLVNLWLSERLKQAS